MSDSSQPVVAIPAELLPYVAVAELIVQTFGQDCEVVLHDLRTPEKSVCYVANGHVTGRKVGESFNHLISQALVAADSAEGVIPNYYFRHHKKLIRSSSLFIRTADGTLLGALCINLDTTKITEQIQLLTSLLPGIEKADTTITPTHFSTDSIDPTNVNHNMLDIVTSLIDSVINQTQRPFTRQRRLEMIQFMESRGVFQMKGAVDIVAETLEMSRVTVYAYIDEVRKMSAD